MFDRNNRSAVFHSLIEPTVAQAAYERLAPRLHALARDELIPIQGDVQAAAAFALGVARTVAEPPLRARIARLGELGEVEEACVADLGDVALSAWYTRHRFLLAGAARPPAKIPVALVDEAMALRRCLLEVAERPLLRRRGSPMGAELAVLEMSCQDLVGDLLVLSTFCAHCSALFPADERAFLEREAQRGQEVSEEILSRMSGASAVDPDSWGWMVRRAWTLLVRTYDEVRRAGRFLLRGPEGEVRFPSLGAVARQRAWPLGLADVYLSEHAGRPE